MEKFPKAQSKSLLSPFKTAIFLCEKTPRLSAEPEDLFLKDLPFLLPYYYLFFLFFSTQN